MSKHIGRKVSMGIAKESVRGTAESDATYWLPIKAFNHENKVENAFNDSAQGTCVPNQDAEIVKEWAEGGGESLIGVDHFGLVLLAFLGAVATSTDDPEAGVNTHTFSLAESSQHQSLTIFQDDPNSDFKYANGGISSLSLNFERGKILDYSLPMMSKKGESATLTPSYSSETIFRPQDFEMKLAVNLAGLDAANEVKVKTLNLTGEKNLEADEVLGEVGPEDFLNKEFKITGSMTLQYDTDTLPDLVFDGTKQAMRVSLVNTAVTIGLVSNPSVIINLAKLVFTNLSNSRGLGDITEITVDFEALYSRTDAEIGTIDLINTVASY